MNLIKKLIFLLAFIYMAGCASSSASAPLVSLNEKTPGMVDYKNTPSADEYPEDDAVMLYNYEYYDVDILYGIGLESYYTNHKVIKIFRNPERFADVVIAVDEDDTIESISVRTILSDGKVIELSQKDIFSVIAQKKGEDYNKTANVIKFNFPQVKEGSILEIKYTLIVKGPYLNGTLNLAQDIPVKEMVYKLSMPKWMIDDKSLDWNWKYKAYNTDSFPAPVEDNEFGDSGDRIFTWKLNNLKSYKSESNMLNPYNYIPFVRFNVSGFSDWNDFSDWYYKKVFKEQLQITEKVKKKAEELTKNMSLEVDKIDAVRKYVQSLFYSATHVYFGHAIKPNTPETIIERGYGDCKDKSILILSLLKALKIKANPVLVGSIFEEPVDTDFVGDYFNHMIIKAETSDKKIFWVDGTMDYHKLGQYGWQYAGTYGLVLFQNGNSKLEKIPELTSSDNKVDVYADAILSKEGLLNTQFTIKAEGMMAVRLRYKTKELNNKQLKKVIKEELLKLNYYPYEIENLTYNNESGNEHNYIVKFNINKVPIANSSGNTTTSADLWPFSFNHLPLAESLVNNTRLYPVFLNMPPHTLSETITISLPEEMKELKTTPEALKASVSENDLEFKKEVEVSDKKITIKEKYIQNKLVISEKKLAEIKAFFNTLTNSRLNTVILSGSFTNKGSAETEKKEKSN